MNTQRHTAVSSKEITTEHIHKFFDEFIAQIEEDKTAMLVGMASKEKNDFYEKAIRKDTKALADEYWEKQSLIILGQMFEQYVNKLLTFPICPTKVAFSFNTPHTISVFAITPDDNRQLSSALVLAEAEIASIYSNKGFKFDSIIFEESDNMSIPHGYNEFKVTK